MTAGDATRRREAALQPPLAAGSLTRRSLLRAGAAGTLVLALRALAPAGAGAAAPRAAGAAAAAPSYRGPGDLYRAAWRWDRVVRGTHLRANCMSACAWNLYVKDGVVWREEQAEVYGEGAPGRPGYAPRGCQKGACYSGLMVGGDRVTHPLERVGPRGSGRWRRISWDRALGRLADAILDAAQEQGPESVVYDNGTSNVDDGPSTIGEMRLFSLLGATLLDGFGGTGDLAMGAVQTWGTTFVDGSADDWTRADALFVWHCNPAATRIPDAHFLQEARYRGTRVVTVSPDYSPSAIHASLWVGPRPGTDAALALGLARAVLESGAVDEDYVREQTDLPLLVREDDGRFLRGSDLEAGGRDDAFYVYDEAAGRRAEAPGTPACWSDSLALGGLRPALRGRFRVRTREGRSLTVRPVMERLRERLAEYGPETVARITGVAPSVQARLAEEVIRARRLLFYPSWGSNKHYHADLFQRALILLSALRGQQGRPGGGVRFAAWLPLAGSRDLVPGARPSFLQRLLLRVYTPPPRAMEAALREASPDLPWTPSHLFLHLHGGLGALQDGEARDPELPRPPRAYLDEALAKGWVRPRPAPGREPRVLVVSGCNPLRRWPAPQVVERTLWPKLRMVAVLDFRMSTTAMKADLVLPAAGYYEKRGIKYAVALAPYVVVGDRAVPPLGEARGEWEITSRLAARIAERARARGLEGALAPLTRLDERMSEGGRYGPKDDEALLDRILRASPQTEGVGWRQARRAGAIPIRSTGGWGPTSSVGSEVETGGTITPSRVHAEERHAWPTLTGRQQFYLDHPWFLEADEALPRWKPLPRPGGAHPILLGGGHTRWSIHAAWRAHPELLRLQRGGPALWMSEEDARARGLADGDTARIRNDHGAFECGVRVTPAVPEGHAVVYHAWEPYQFPGWRGNMEVVSSPYKPLHFAGGYGHLTYRLFQAGPVHVPRGVPVEIERAAQPGSAAARS